MNGIDEKISFYRKAKGMTQEELAEQLGVSPQAVSKWENGAACPDIQLLVPLARIFAITTDELLSAEAVNSVRLLDETEKKELKDLTLKVLVDSSDGDKVRINLPMELIKTALEIGLKIPKVAEHAQLKDIDFEQIITLVETGVIGKLVEVESAQGDVVNIVVE